MSDRTMTRRVEAEVWCMHCGHAAGLLRREVGTSDAPTMFHDGTGGSVAVGSLAALRCMRCGGSLYAGDYQLINAYTKLSLLEKPRLGRPPKCRTEAPAGGSSASAPHP